MTESNAPHPLVLCILDGWGVRDEVKDNAILQARTPVWDRIMETYPHGLLEASEESVGLPKGQFGNSEVGHMNIGAGRILLQDLLRIDAAIADDSLADNPALKSFVNALKDEQGTCHIIGLLSPGGVHAHEDHILALIRVIAGQGVPVALHAILDGRDTPPLSAGGSLEKVTAAIKGLGNVRIASVTGRYYAMDRDRRWKRVAPAYAAIADGDGKRVSDAFSALEASYDLAVTDEFMIPTVIGNYGGMADGDGLLMANFRADRVREILSALLDPDFNQFPRQRPIRFSAALGMTEYSRALNKFLATMLPSHKLENTLGEVVAKKGLRQLRIAETEKYAHVTFFLNGGEEREFDGEDRILVSSPRVATYDLQPEMSAPEVTAKLVGAIESGTYDLIIANFANADMVGHTGIMSAAVKAVETLDSCLDRVVAAVESVGGAMLITADHGNIEIIHDSSTHQPHTSHTSNPVPSVLIGAGDGVKALRHGCLADIAPTLLDIMGIEQPAEMTGRSLLDTSSAKQSDVRAISA